MSEALFELQNAFAERIRSPSKTTIPAGIAPDRMAVYEDLMFGGLKECLQTAFPVLSEVISETLQNDLVSGFLETHQAKTPLFYELPEEFLIYLMQEREAANDPPYLAELAHFEWVELAMELMDEPVPEPLRLGLAKPEDSLKLAPLLQVLGYTYPVHEISNEFEPTEADKGSYFIAIYRNGQCEVQMLAVSLLAARLLQLLQQYELNRSKVTQILADEMQRPVEAHFETEITSLIEQLQLKGVILSA